MIWLTVRQHRLVFALVVGGAIALAVALLGVVAYANGIRSELIAARCALPSAPTCLNASQDWSIRVGPLQYTFLALLLFPALVASYLGGPLLAREFERGTHRLVLTQNVTRVGWAGTKLAIAIAVALAASAVLALVGGQASDLMGSAFSSRPGQRPWDVFDFQGPALLGFTAFGVAVGAFIGALHRRILTGMFVGLLAFALVRGIVGGSLRPNYEPPVMELIKPTLPITGVPPFPLSPSTNVPADAWMLNPVGFDGQGRPVPSERVRSLLDEFGRGGCSSSLGQNCDSTRYLNEHDVYQYAPYQPADRYWRFQLYEAGIYAMLTVAFVAGTLILLKRRDA